MTELLAATALAIEQARAASAATFARARWNPRETAGVKCCPHCQLRIVDTRAGLQPRAAIHARCCPGGARATEVWFPYLSSATSVPPVSRPVLRLIRGGLVTRPTSS